jgi:hypothetical protein
VLGRGYAFQHPVTLAQIRSGEFPPDSEKILAGGSWKARIGIVYYEDPESQRRAFVVWIEAAPGLTESLRSIFVRGPDRRGRRMSNPRIRLFIEPIGLTSITAGLLDRMRQRSLDAVHGHVMLGKTGMNRPHP